MKSYFIFILLIFSLEVSARHNSINGDEIFKWIVDDDGDKIALIFEFSFWKLLYNIFL